MLLFAIDGANGVTGGVGGGVGVITGGAAAGATAGATFAIGDCDCACTRASRGGAVVALAIGETAVFACSIGVTGWAERLVAI